MRRFLTLGWMLPVAIVWPGATSAQLQIGLGGGLTVPTGEYWEGAQTSTLLAGQLAFGVSNNGQLGIGLSYRPSFLEGAALTWIGTISYGVYVIHHTITPWSVEHISHPAWRALVLVGVSLVVAQLSWVFFESPLLKLKRLFPMPTSGQAERSGGHSSDAVAGGGHLQGAEAPGQP